MNWNHFLLLLTCLYLGYYALNIVADILMANRVPAIEKEQDILFFTDDVEPELILPEEDIPEETGTAQQSMPSLNGTPPGIVSGLLESTGAVVLKDLFRLAQEDLIQYTKAITYT